MLALPWVRRIYLEDLAAIPDPSFGLQLLSLLVEDPTAVASHAQRLAQQTRAQAIPLPLLPLECLDLLEILLVYRLPQLTRQEIQTMLGFTHAEFKQSRFYQEVTAESRQEGYQEGIHALALRLVKRRLGSLSAAQELRMGRLSPEQTEALAEAVFDFQTAADLTAWLAALPEIKTSSN